MIEITREMREQAAEYVDSNYLSSASRLIREGKCPICDKEVKELPSQRHVDEFLESGMCVKCQSTTKGPAK
jgi:hypothetical protein